MSAKTEFTPPPWTVRSEPTMLSGDEGDRRAWFSFEAAADHGSFAEHEANARLMEAAPEMYAALAKLDKWFSPLGASIRERWESVPPIERKAIVDAVRSALAKASDARAA